VDFTVVGQNVPALLQAAGVTVELSVSVIVLSSVLGALAAIAHWSGNAVVRSVLNAYSWLMRCTPGLILLFFVYYGLPQVGISLPAFGAGVAALTAQAVAYNMEIFLSGLRGVPRGQFDAAHALAVPGPRLWLNVIGPQALRISTPAWFSNNINNLKGSSIASVITIGELTGITYNLIGITYKAVELLVFIALVYLAMNSILIGIQKLVERRLSPGDRTPRIPGALTAPELVAPR
jgi:His/Glu/Gln/Arg/opine family amino acid ABC transporter permease subunit